jgi:hypothetical protein
LIANIKSVLGPNPLLWLWPQTVKNDGLSYPVSKAADGEFSNQVGGEEWQDMVGSGRGDEDANGKGTTYSRRETEALLRSREGIEEV